MTTVTIDPVNDERYRTFINAHPSATVFHTPEWMQVLADTYRFKPVAYAVAEGDVLSGVVPFCETRSFAGKKRLVSLPYSDFCEPLLSSEDEVNAIISHIKDENKDKYKYCEFRGGRALLGNTTAGRTVVTHCIDCTPDEEVLFTSLKNTVQRNIKKAEREGLTCTIDNKIESVRQFYDLNCVTRRDHGLPPQPWTFFENIWNYLIKIGNGFIATVNLNGKAIASTLFLVYNRKAFYKFGASIKKALYHRPNDFILWKSLLYCKQIKCHAVNLGRTEPEHSGLLQFKRGWNSCETCEFYYHYDFNSNSYIPIKKTVCDTLYPMIFTRMPMVLLKPIGSSIHQFAG